MPWQILLNLIIAGVWMFLHDAWNVASFSVGYVLGLILLFAMRHFFPERFYAARFIAIIKLIVLFLKELVVSSIIIIQQITRRELDIAPGVIKLETPLRGEWEITTLSCLITLTPGSVVLETCPEQGILYVHAMDIPKGKNMIIETQKKFEKAIMEVTR